MVDGSSSLNTADKLSLLLERRRRWRDLDWATGYTVPIPGQYQAYELVGGSFAKAIGDAEGSTALNVTSLPSRTQTPSSILLPDLGVIAKDFAIDPSQDLLVLLETVPSTGM